MSPRIGLALGGGGARGFAHVHVIEALDEMGLPPVAISGCSIGAIFGAGRAAGLDGRALHGIVHHTFRNAGEVWGRMWQLRPKKFGEIFSTGFAQFDAERTIDVFLPPEIPDDFAALQIPFSVVTTDFYDCREVEFTAGPLRQAIAASIAIPVIFKPVEIAGRIFIDGGVVNPLPYDRLPAEIDIVIAVDVIGGPTRQPTRARPSAMESVFGASQILMQSVLTEKLRTRQPDILIKPPVDAFRVLDFMKASAILKATQPVKDEVKRKLEALLEKQAAE
ncbi:patatin-like phospholipase family protein [Methylobrevis pamukkalensis]|uniref:NTE family protein RssA n=1 Tax=Methylobrevis pamukkalensis TaxID=1439726 RepID=A0A1E3H5M2_9HYPH|nr:patatin-like phospholipase family protein [Methylobrevis pamukkalensis]ODN71612.1 NTE family protein RssA [Methylobrevis pamukkalensis]